MKGEIALPSEYKAQIGGATFQFTEHSFDDQKVTGGQIAEAVRAHPVTDYLVLQQLPNLELEALRPNEVADLTKSIRFFVIKGDATYNLVVDGLSMVWPEASISGHTIIRLIMQEDGSLELLLKREDEPDKIIEPTDQVNIAKKGVEEFATRLHGGRVIIIVEGSPHEWTEKRISFDQVVSLEVPDYAQHPEITYAVRYKDGPRNKPEGILVKGSSVKVVNRMVFYVSETGQS
ncbi:multiubiquitin domain-containing protein [Neorhizobium galegae]|uniref:multiubiquitin domain-containing protein n=1 Tax=Neorhizobium galegae TaxID=399 RepID=UPI0009B885AC|nr:multiubiquitin domain-containing protein [Neorhizobium galegae]